MLFYVHVVAYYFYSRLVYLFSAYRKCYDPMNPKNPSHCLTPPQWKNKLYRMKHALWWPLDLGWVQLRVRTVRSRFTAHYDPVMILPNMTMLLSSTGLHVHN